MIEKPEKKIIEHANGGKGLYTDNDTTYEMKPGDAAFCKNGDRHGIENIGDEDLVFMGLIIYDK